MKKSNQWFRLDNAAKIFPPTCSKRDTKVFRFVCELKEPVDQTILQHALDKTVEVFPLYHSVLKKGIFWYYLEESDIKPQVFEENIPACAPLYDSYNHRLLFRVSYYKKRINLEVFHSLSDGTGAIQFLKTMVYYYLEERHNIKIMTSNDFTSLSQKNADAFSKYYDKSDTIKKHVYKKAHIIKGERIPKNNVSIIEGIMPSSAVLRLAHENNATFTEFLIADLICSIYDNMTTREKRHPIIINVPVNLRQFFPSETTRNFFCVINVEYTADKSECDFADVIKKVKLAFESQLTKDNIQGIINKFSVIENNPVVRVIPLLLKIPIMRFSSYLADCKNTSSFSNLGRIDIHENAAEYINMFDVFVKAKRPQMCFCTIGDKLAIGVSSPLVSKEIERSFFCRLADMGVDVQIISNLSQFEM